jgi:hypothetical protein
MLNSWVSGLRIVRVKHWMGYSLWMWRIAHAR